MASNALVRSKKKGIDSLLHCAVTNVFNKSITEAISKRVKPIHFMQEGSCIPFSCFYGGYI